MTRKLYSTCLVLTLGASYALTAYPQVKPEVLVKQRQAVMTLQGKYMGPLAGMLKGVVPYDEKVVARNAGYLEVLSKMPWDGFDPSTRDVKSQALPAVFTERGKFKEAQDRLQTAIAQLVAAAKVGSEGPIKTAIGDVGKACGNCHENFREKQ